MNLHIHRSRGHYIGQVRRTGARNWQDCTGKCRTAELAIARAALRFNGYKRIRVLFCDTSGYYDPNLVFEGRRT